MNYYFLSSLLPQLEIGHVPTLGFFELKELLKINLSKEDQKRLTRFLRWIDVENFRALWSDQPIDPRGNLTKEELALALQNLNWCPNEEFPEYLKDYLEKYRTDEERRAHFSELMSTFLAKESELRTGFIADYFTFERYFRLVVTGFRAKKLGRNVEHELQFEDPYDPIVAQIFAQKDVKAYEPPFEFKDLRPIFEQKSDEPLELHRALIEYRFQQIQEMSEGEIFSFAHILSYLSQLILVEKWLELNLQEGMNVIDSVEENIK